MLHQSVYCYKSIGFESIPTNIFEKYYVRNFQKYQHQLEATKTKLPVFQYRALENIFTSRIWSKKSPHKNQAKRIYGKSRCQLWGFYQSNASRQSANAIAVFLICSSMASEVRHRNDANNTKLYIMQKTQSFHIQGK